MLSSPITITIGTQAFTLLKKNQDNYGSVWLDKLTVPGTEVKLTLRNAYEGTTKLSATQLTLAKQKQYERHIADLEVTVFDSDGYPTVTQTYTHIRNIRGGSAAFAGDVGQALAVFINANADNLVNWDT